MIVMITIIMSLLYYYYCAGITAKRSTTVRSLELYSNTEINEKR